MRPCSTFDGVRPNILLCVFLTNAFLTHLFPQVIEVANSWLIKNVPPNKKDDGGISLALQMQKRAEEEERALKEREEMEAREREEREKTVAGTKDLPGIEVLRSLSRILPEGGT